MAEWTRDAKEYLEGYLLQTAALARSRNDEVDEIVDELRNHILIETEKEAGSVVSLDQLRKVLSALGTPEQVYGQEGTLEGIRRPVVVDGEGPIRPEVTPVIIPPILPGVTPQAPQSAPKKSKRGYTTAVILASIAVIMVVAVVAGLVVLRYSGILDIKVVMFELKATETMRQIGEAERNYLADKTGNGGVGEYGTIAQLSEGGFLSKELIKDLVQPGYIIEVKVSQVTTALTSSERSVTPHFVCITRFNKALLVLQKSRDLQLDETGSISPIDEGGQNTGPLFLKPVGSSGDK